MILESHQFGRTLNVDAGALEVIDQQALVLILRKDEKVRKWGESGPNRSDVGSRDVPAVDPEVHRVERDGARDDVVGDPQLAIELQGAGMDHQRSRRGSRLGDLVDDPDGDAAPRQPEREHEAGWTRADDKHLWIGHAER